jgi:hypothetical protein
MRKGSAACASTSRPSARAVSPTCARASARRSLLALVPRWLEDDALTHRVLVDNPAKLYEFK